MSTLAKMEAVVAPVWVLVGVLVTCLLVFGVIGAVIFALTRKPRN